MAKSQQTFSKKEKEKKRLKKRKEKLERRAQRKMEREENGPKSFEDMIMYVDEDGNLTSTKPDPKKKKKDISLEDIVVGARPIDDTPEETVRQGQVKFFNEEKGYGFIIDGKTKDSLFVHANGCLDPVGDNDRVTFEVEMGKKGPNAVNVRLA